MRQSVRPHLALLVRAYPQIGPRHSPARKNKSGRLIFSLNYSESDFAAVAERFVAAAKAMERDGWWWCDQAASSRTIKRRILREMIAHRLRTLR